MTRLDDLPFYDRDPDAKEQATEASKARVRGGLKKLVEALQRPLNDAAEIEAKRLHEQSVELNRRLAERDGFTTSPGCSIPVSPTLQKMLEPARFDQV